MRNFLFDTHAHIDHQRFDTDRENILQECEELLQGWINVGSDLESSLIALEYTEKYNKSWAAVGFHPHEAIKASEDELQKIFDLFALEKVVAAGEIGLDYHYNFSPPEQQREVFRKQVKAAQKHNMPMIFHVREAYDDFFSITNEENCHNGVIHCFSGNEKQAAEAVEMGFYISFNGILTFPRSEKERKIAGELPLEKILIETDAPYLTPVPWRGRRNKPTYVIHVAECLAAIRGLSLEETCLYTWENACRLFKLNLKPTEKISEGTHE
jgi:TatD DNase family protein